MTRMLAVVGIFFMGVTPALVYPTVIRSSRVVVFDGLGR